MADIQIDITTNLAEAVDCCMYDLERAMELLEEVRKEQPVLSDEHRVMISIVDGRFKYIDGAFIDAYKCLNYAVNLGKNNPHVDKKYFALCYKHLGILSYYNQDLTNALNYYTLSHKHDSSTENSINMYNNTGDLYVELKEYEKAEEYFNKALRLTREVEYVGQHFFSILYFNMGRCYSFQKKYLESDMYLQKAKSLFIELGSEGHYLMEIIIACGENWISQKNYKKAEVELLSAVEIADRSESKLFFVRAYRLLAENYLRLGNAVEYNLRMKIALEAARKNKLVNEQYLCLSSLRGFYQTREDTNNYHEVSIELLEILEDKKDSLELSSLFSVLTEQDERLFSLERMNKVIRQQKQDLEDFAYATAHHLKEPLRNIFSFSQLLEKSTRELSTESSEYMNFIISNAKRSDLLLSNLVTFFSLGAPSNIPSAINTDEVLEDVLHHLTMKYPDVNIKTDIESLPGMNILPHHCELLFTHLIENAIKFRANPDSCRIKIYFEGNKLNNRLVFEDYGIGIPKQYREKIFNLFYVIDREGYEQSSGFGLTLCKKILALYSAYISVESDDHCPTRFVIQFPMVM